MQKSFKGTFKNLLGQSLIQRQPDPSGRLLIDEKGIPLIGSDGKPIVATLETPCNISDMVCTALLFDYPNEVLDAKEKHVRFKLAQRIHNAHATSEGNTEDSSINEVNVSSEEIILIKSLMAKIYNALIVGQLVDILEG
jgi:hypothetical protein